MQENYLNELERLLSKNQDYLVEGVLNKNKVAELAHKYDAELIEQLAAAPAMRRIFFVETKQKVLVFNKDKFIQFISNKEFLPDSFTTYKNKIGLGTGTDLLSEHKEVVLNWPYKDCVLEGGQDKEDAKRDEVFYNEVLAPDQIDRLLDEKVLTGWKRYDRDGEHDVQTVTADDNLVIRGNNLLALHSLRRRYAGKVKLIYIDPPYNTGSDSFGYNDRFNHSTWLTFMKNRLTVAKDLLRNDGAIFVQCDDNEQAYLKVLLDEIFGSGNFLNTIVIRTKLAGVSGSHEGKSLQNNTEYILFYAKDKGTFKIHKNIYKKEELVSFISRYETEGKSWKYTSVLTDIDDGEYVKTIADGYGDKIEVYKHSNYLIKSVSEVAKREFGGDTSAVYLKYSDRIFRTTNAQSSIRQRVEDETKDIENPIISIKYVPKTGKNAGEEVRLYYKDKIRNLITWLSAVVTKEGKNLYKVENAGNLWDDIQYNNLTREGDIVFANGKKPEKILENVISLATESGDIVLDYHLGSGTTAAVAHKMGRKYIGIEQLNYGAHDTVERLQKVLVGDKSGISSNVGWTGGGSFVYARLMDLGNKFTANVKDASTDKELIELLEQAKKSSFLSYKVDPEKINPGDKDFASLSIAHKKQLLLEIVDHNHLYVNYSEIDDKDYGVSAADKDLNKQFYSN